MLARTNLLVRSKDSVTGEIIVTQALRNGVQSPNICAEVELRIISFFSNKTQN